MQIIQSLGEAMSWFERELGWGVPPTELRHLSGRIGELYAALITNGQMAANVNQPGYDIVGESGERVSVKTTGMMTGSGHVSFNPNTLSLVDRIIVLRINTDEMQIETLLNDTTANVIKLMSSPDAKGRRSISLSKLTKPTSSRTDIPAVSTVQFGPYTVTALENATIQVFHDGELVSPTRPILRKLAAELGIGLLNSNGNQYNIRQLGSLVIDSIASRGANAG